MGSVAISFIILLGSSYGISSVLLKKNLKIHEPSFKIQQSTTRIVRLNKSDDEWFV